MPQLSPELVDQIFVAKMRAVFQSPFKVDADQAALEYWDFLARYPADVLAKAWDKCRGVHAGPRWPTIAECRAFCEEASKLISLSAPKPAGARESQVEFSWRVHRELRAMANRTGNDPDLEAWSQGFGDHRFARQHVAWQVEIKAFRYVADTLRADMELARLFPLGDTDWADIEARITTQLRTKAKGAPQKSETETVKAIEAPARELEVA